MDINKFGSSDRYSLGQEWTQNFFRWTIYRVAKRYEGERTKKVRNRGSLSPNSSFPGQNWMFRWKGYFEEDFL